MQEKNKHILQKAIQELPQYEPEALVWLAIDGELEVIEKEDNLQNAINELPTYNPSDSLWENIDAELEADIKKAGRVVWLKRISSVAAVIVFLIVGNFIFNQNNSQENITISYSQEVVEDDFLKQDWDEDDDAFEMVMAYCKTENIVCELPEFIVLKTELEDLNNAREELKNALDHYGTDAELIAQLTRIEHDRSDVLKQMIAKI
jgi:hypothetical protein